jgi:predicted histidine transporter YuiF (NhaC family)
MTNSLSSNSSRGCGSQRQLVYVKVVVVVEIISQWLTPVHINDVVLLLLGLDHELLKPASPLISKFKS